ncbi:hypothetical protein [Pseudooceanicola marinus]|uniref:hypothetical protein n=1 Tax=Pseudooceanicola marinus TaxID=396013 RepID=UPI001CD3B1CF|nr:hypothetical protein [Pseudooceanicola marinus]MCA1337532.1 hypothetical protein [Pseudooceanicola marinus]
MTAYHWALLGVAALGTLACVTATRGPDRVEAVVGLGAMGLAMTGVPALLYGGVTVLALLALPPLLWSATGRQGRAMCLHRAASNLVMAAVLLALYALNGPALCGDAALPLLTAEGVTLLPMSRASALFVQGTALALMLYALLSLRISWGVLERGRAAALMEILPMSLATIGMAVRIT